MSAHLDKGPVMRSDVMDNVLGTPLFELQQGQMKMLPPLPKPPAEERLVVRLDAILEELAGLRVDLYHRSVHGRWQRFWAWLKGLVR